MEDARPLHMEREAVSLEDVRITGNVFQNNGHRAFDITTSDNQQTRIKLWDKGMGESMTVEKGDVLAIAGIWSFWKGADGTNKPSDPKSWSISIDTTKGGGIEYDNGRPPGGLLDGTEPPIGPAPVATPSPFGGVADGPRDHSTWWTDAKAEMAAATAAFPDSSEETRKSWAISAQIATARREKKLPTPF